MSYPEHLSRLVNDYLTVLDYGEEPAVSPLAEAMRYSLLAGGKRIRPVLVMATGEAFGADPAALLPTAVALEMIHTYSLIHDDLPSFDDDDLRRGLPTSHVKHGEAVAILAGDALFAEAFRLICERQEAVAVVLREVIREISLATGVKGMVGGQYLDVAGSDTISTTISRGVNATDTATAAAPDAAGQAAHMELLHSLKTGRMIMACVHCGALLAGAPESQLTKLRRFSAQLGLLFQIKDDILDVVGDTAVLGKKAGSDERLQRLTYVSVFGLDEAERLAIKSWEKSLQALKEVNGATATLAQITDYICERRQ